MPWILLHQTFQMSPSQLTIDALTTATPKLADVPPQSIKHRCLEYHYTKLGRCTPQSIEHRCLEYCYTKLGKCTPQSIKHRLLEYCYTNLGKCILPPSQSSIDALNITTPNLADVPQSIHHRCLEYHHTKTTRSIYRTIHIYPWQIDSPSQFSIDALTTATPNLAHLMAEQCTYTYGRLIHPSHLSIDTLNIVTPNVADVPQSIDHRCLEYHYTKPGRSI